MLFRTLSTQSVGYIEEAFTLSELSSTITQATAERLIDSSEKVTTVYIDSYETSVTINKEV